MLEESDPIAMVDAIVSTAMDDLEATGALQHSNRMDIAELLNPAVETHNVFEATDEDIFETVMAAKEAREANVGGSDEVIEQGVQVVEEPILSRQEALQVAVALQKYVNTLEDSFLRQFEVMLGSFGNRTRAADMRGMKESKITSYFQP